MVKVDTEGFAVANVTTAMLADAETSARRMHLASVNEAGNGKAAIIDGLRTIATKRLNHRQGARSTRKALILNKLVGSPILVDRENIDQRIGPSQSGRQSAAILAQCFRDVAQIGPVGDPDAIGFAFGDMLTVGAKRNVERAGYSFTQALDRFILDASTNEVRGVVINIEAQSAGRRIGVTICNGVAQIEDEIVLIFSVSAVVLQVCIGKRMSKGRHHFDGELARGVDRCSEYGSGFAVMLHRSGQCSAGSRWRPDNVDIDNMPYAFLIHEDRLKRTGFAAFVRHSDSLVEGD